MRTTATDPDAPGSARARLAVALGLLAFVVSLRVVQDPDYFTHLALGRAFVEARSIRFPEPFLDLRDSPPGRAEAIQTYKGWPFQIALYGLRAVAGDAGISLAVALLAGCVATLLALLLPREVTPARLALGGFLVAAGVMVARFRFSPRAELPGYVFFASALVAVDRWRNGGARWILLAIGALAAWGGIHPAWTMGAGAIGLLILAGRPVSWWVEHLRKRKLLVVPLMLFAAAAAWSGAGFAMHVFRQVSHGVFAAVTEMRPTWEFPTVLWPFAALAGATLAVAVGGREGRWRRGAVWLVGALAGLVVVRNVAFGSLTMLAAALPGLTELPRPGWERRAGRGATILAATAVAAMTAIALADRDPPWGLGVDWGMFPRDAASFVKEKSLPEPIFNSWDYGGYVDFAWGGRPKTFLDGRLGDPATVGDHDGLTEATDPERVIRQRGFRTLLIKPLYDNSGGLVPIVPRLLADPRWSLVRASDALVFVRAPFPPGVDPLAPEAGWLAVANLAAHFVRNSPAASDAPYVRAIALSNAGRAEQAEAAWCDAVRMHPELERRFTGR